MGNPAPPRDRSVTSYVQIEHVPFASLRPDPANPRRISGAELETVTRTIAEFGFIDSVIARRDDKLVIGGTSACSPRESLVSRPFPWSSFSSPQNGPICSTSPSTRSRASGTRRCSLGSLPTGATAPTSHCQAFETMRPETSSPSLAGWSLDRLRRRRKQQYPRDQCRWHRLHRANGHGLSRRRVMGTMTNKPIPRGANRSVLEVEVGAGDETRTSDPLLGKQMLYH